MPFGPPPPPNFEPGFESTFVHISEQGVDEFIRKAWNFDNIYHRKIKEVFTGITRELRESAQARSPYLYGILQSSHLDEVQPAGDSWQGIVHIDPSTWHPVLGGRPVEYGARIHGTGRPWFAWTVEADADEIVEHWGAEIVNAYSGITNAPHEDFRT